MADPTGSKTVANTYTNRKGVERAQVMFDASKLNVSEDNKVTLPKALVSELEAAFTAKRA